MHSHPLFLGKRSSEHLRHSRQNSSLYLKYSKPAVRLRICKLIINTPVQHPPRERETATEREAYVYVVYTAQSRSHFAILIFGKVFNFAQDAEKTRRGGRWREGGGEGGRETEGGERQ